MLCGDGNTDFRLPFLNPLSGLITVMIVRYAYLRSFHRIGWTRLCLLSAGQNSWWYRWYSTAAAITVTIPSLTTNNSTTAELRYCRENYMVAQPNMIYTLWVLCVVYRSQNAQIIMGNVKCAVVFEFRNFFDLNWNRKRTEKKIVRNLRFHVTAIL